MSNFTKVRTGLLLSKIPIGTRVRFLVELSEGPNDYSPGSLFASKGEEGKIVGHGTMGLYNYSAKTDSWPSPFGCEAKEFEVIAP